MLLLAVRCVSFPPCPPRSFAIQDVVLASLLKVVIAIEEGTGSLWCEVVTIIVNLRGALIAAAIRLSADTKISIHVHLTDKQSAARVVYVDPENRLYCDAVSNWRSRETSGECLCRPMTRKRLRLKSGTDPSVGNSRPENRGTALWRRRVTTSRAGKGAPDLTGVRCRGVFFNNRAGKESCYSSARDVLGRRRRPARNPLRGPSSTS